MQKNHISIKAKGYILLLGQKGHITLEQKGKMNIVSKYQDNAIVGETKYHTVSAK